MDEEKYKEIIRNIEKETKYEAKDNQLYRKNGDK